MRTRLAKLTCQSLTLLHETDFNDSFLYQVLHLVRLPKVKITVQSEREKKVLKLLVISSFFFFVLFFSSDFWYGVAETSVSLSYM